jgi:hypothetical protein
MIASPKVVDTPSGWRLINSIAQEWNGEGGARGPEFVEAHYITWAHRLRMRGAWGVLGRCALVSRTVSWAESTTAEQVFDQRAAGIVCVGICAYPGSAKSKK